MPMLSSVFGLAASVAHRSIDRQGLVVEVQRLLLLAQIAVDNADVVQRAASPPRSPTAGEIGSAWL